MKMLIISIKGVQTKVEKLPTKLTLRALKLFD